MAPKNRKHSVQPRACAFCGTAGGMSKEHVWPQWLRPLAGDVGSDRWTQAAGFRRSAADAFAELPTVTTQQPGSVLNMVNRNVCTRCNNGWMSQLETRTQPVVELLIAALRSGVSAVVGPHEAAIVAAWTIKTGWMRQLSVGTYAGDLTAARRMLHETQLPPTDSIVWLARHEGDLNFNLKQAVVGINRGDRDWADQDLRHAIWTCLTFQGLMLLSYTVDGWGVPAPPARDPARWARLWPSTEAVCFPPPSPTSDFDATLAVAHHAGWLQFPQVPRFERVPHGPLQVRRN